MPGKTLEEQPQTDEKPVPGRRWIDRLYTGWMGHKHGNFRALFYLSMAALAVQTGLLLLALFEPPLPYTVSRAPAESLDSPEFLHILSALTGAPVRHFTDIQVFTNGEHYYPAEIEAIRQAKHNINIEAYIFQKGEVTKQIVAALTERAKAGVHVNLLIDAVGSTSYRESNLDELKKAGGRVAWYHALRWYTWPRMNNRTHRELIVIDGITGFVGGSGFADHWLLSEEKDPRWRDTMVRMDGEVVTGLQATFAENWLESSGEILTGREYFPLVEPAGGDPALIVSSSPGAGRSTEARLLFQILLASAKRSIYITTPYFLPDKSIRDELIRAIEKRHVDVRVVVPGHKSDHALTRSSSRGLYGELLKAGAKIFEYQPSMIHAKILIVDGLWSIAGSTNMDARSFGLNDEVNLAVADPPLAARLAQDFWHDVSQSREITYDQWKSRPITERAQEWLGSILERQQ